LNFSSSHHLDSPVIPYSLELTTTFLLSNLGGFIGTLIWFAFFFLVDLALIYSTTPFAAGFVSDVGLDSSVIDKLLPVSLGLRANSSSL